MRQIAFRGRPASWWASVAAVLSVTAAVLAAPPAALAQSQERPPTLSTLFEDIFGPRGLVLNSDDVQLDGSNHAAHFNSAFQSEFRLMNVALTSQLATVPLPSPASGFTYHFDPADRHVRSLDAQLRPDPGRARRDHRPRQDRVRLHVSVLLLRPPGRRADHGHPGGIHPRQSASRRRPCRRRGDGEHHRGDGGAVHGRAHLRGDRPHRSVAGGARRAHAPVAPLERDDPPHRHRQRPRRALFPRSGRDRGLRIDPPVLLGRLRRRHRRPRGARQGNGHAGGVACARRRPRRAHADRRRAEPARLWCGGHEAVRGVLDVDGRLRAARQRWPTSGTARA